MLTRLLLAALLASLAFPGSAAGWSWPVSGEVITPYRNGDDPYAGGQHRGIDISAAAGTPVGAAAAGTVTFAGVAGSSGLTVSVRTADGRFDTSYLHLSSAAVVKGDRVGEGARLGAAGTTGRRSAAAPHLHFGVRDAGQPPRLPRPAHAASARPSGAGARGASWRAGAAARTGPRRRPGASGCRARRPCAPAVRCAFPPAAEYVCPCRRRVPRPAPLRPLAPPRLAPLRAPRLQPRAAPRARPGPPPRELPAARAPRGEPARRAAPERAGARRDYGMALACLGLLLAAACLGLRRGGGEGGARFGWSPLQAAQRAAVRVTRPRPAHPRQ